MLYKPVFKIEECSSIRGYIFRNNFGLSGIFTHSVGTESDEDGCIIITKTFIKQQLLKLVILAKVKNGSVENTVKFHFSNKQFYSETI